MVRFLKRKPKEEPARQRYPEALWPLLSLGRPDDNTDYHQLAEPLADYVPHLIQMALDEDLNQRYEDDPAVWAPLHAMQILGALGAVEAAEPLAQCLDWDDDWTGEALPDIYASIGPMAVPVLQAYLEDASRDKWGRIKASEALTAIAQAHPAQRESIVRYLTDYLGRPTADDNADEELVTSFVISNLAGLGAREAYPAIKRAFEEDRVTLSVIRLEDVEADFGMRPRPDYSKLEPPKEPGVRLELKCKVCGRERSYLFPKVYCDIGTVKKKKAKYSPIIIPQPVVCSKCGAVDQYELSSLGHLAVTADLMAQIVPDLEGIRREDQHIQFVEFQAMGRKMHPQEAIERYQAKIARHPDDSDLYVGYGNVLRFLGRFEEARAQYQRAMEVDPLNPHPYVEMSVLALKQRNNSKAISLLERAIEVARAGPLSEQDKEMVIQSAQEAIRAIRRGKVDELIPEPTVQLAPVGAPPSSSQAQTTSKRAKRKRRKTPHLSSRAQPPKRIAAQSTEVGRNDPCPCGSGKKYKYCCMRKQKR